MIDEKQLSEIITGGAGLRLVEPHIFSTLPEGQEDSDYDKSFGNIYDIIACNRFYNRLIWGYWPREFASLCHDALRSSSNGWVLDAGCGSLAFTARTYSGYSGRPVVLLDRSIKLLRMARARMVKIAGQVPSNMVFLHGDALSLPFRPGSFSTVIALNLLHALEDAGRLLLELKMVLADGGAISLTTLIKNNRRSDGYLQALADAGKLVPRDAGQLLALFNDAGMPVKPRIQGNMAFVGFK